MHLKAILLGPDGQLGRDVRRAHARFGNGIELIPLGRESLDVSARGAVESVLRGLDFDVLVNCAAYTAVDEAEGRAALAYSVNADAVRAMAKVCSAKRARFIHVSTDYVFGEDSTRNRPLREHDPIAPVNVYGASKGERRGTRRPGIRRCRHPSRRLPVRSGGNRRQGRATSSRP